MSSSIPAFGRFWCEEKEHWCEGKEHCGHAKGCINWRNGA